MSSDVSTPRGRADFRAAVLEAVRRLDRMRARADIQSRLAGGVEMFPAVTIRVGDQCVTVRPQSDQELAAHLEESGARPAKLGIAGWLMLIQAIMKMIAEIMGNLPPAEPPTPGKTK